MVPRPPHFTHPRILRRWQAFNADEICLSVLRHVNRVRTDPQRAAAEFRRRLSGCFRGETFTPPWAAVGSTPLVMKEGQAALDELCAPPSPAAPRAAVLHRPAMRGRATRSTHPAGQRPSPPLPALAAISPMHGCPPIPPAC